MKVTTTTTHPKLDLLLNSALRLDLNAEVKFLLESTKPLTKDEIDELTKQGCIEVTPLADNFYSVSTKTGFIKQIADLSFVNHLKLKREHRIH